MRLFSYIVVSDSGLAPNPFGSYCTLAVCKPRIRNAAKVGDWVVGLTPKKLGNKLVYAMQVKEKLSFDEYFNDERFEAKKPKLSSQKITSQCGDNFYHITNGCYQQEKNKYHDESNEKRDLSSKYVLVSGKDDFYYFGSEAVELPEKLKQKIVVERGHRSKFEEETIKDFIQFINSLEDKKWATDRLPKNIRIKIKGE